MNEKSNEEIWREEFEKELLENPYAKRSDISRSEKHPNEYSNQATTHMWLWYLAGRKAGQIELDQFKNTPITEELATLRAENEKLLNWKIHSSDEIANLTDELEALKLENERLKFEADQYISELKRADDNLKSFSRGIDDKLLPEIKRLKSLVERAKPWVSEQSRELINFKTDKQVEMKNWLSDAEKEGVK